MKAPPPTSVLYVTYDGLLEPLGASQVLPYVRALKARGFSMGVLSFEKPADLDRADAVVRVQDELETLGVPWTALRYHKRPSLPATLWDVMAGRRHARSWASSFPAGEARLVHARGYVSGLMGLAARGRGAKLLFDMRGFWVDERVAAGYWRPDGLPARVGRWMERTLLLGSDELILLTRKGGERLASLGKGGNAKPWVVVPTCVDVERFVPPADPSAARAALGIARAPVVIHTGTVTGWYDGRLTMAAGKAFVERTGGSFVVLTRDVDEARRQAAEVGADPLIRTVEPHEVPRWLQAADAGLALPRISPSKDASFPTKIAEYLACGLAVLATPIGDVADFADGEVLGLMGGELEQVAQGITWLAAAAAAPGRAARARAIAVARLSVASGSETLAGVYRRLGLEPAIAASRPESQS